MFKCYTPRNSADVEAAILHIQEYSGNMKFDTDPDSGEITCMLVIAEEMLAEIQQCLPCLLKCNIMFVPMNEYYKLWIACYLSPYTDHWEISALIFLAMETKEYIQKGIKFSKDTFAGIMAEKLIYM